MYLLCSLTSRRHPRILELLRVRAAGEREKELQALPGHIRNVTDSNGGFGNSYAH